MRMPRAPGLTSLLTTLVALPLGWAALAAVAAAFNAQAWLDLLDHPGLWRALGMTLWTGLAATGVSVAASAWILSRSFPGAAWRTTLRWLPPMLSVPHAALAIGVAFLIAPSGWLLRALSPWATGLDAPPPWQTTQDPWGLGLITVLVAVPLGLAAGVRKGSAVDRASTAVGLVAFSAPTFAVGFLLLYVFAVELGWFPSFGSGDGFFDTLHHMTLPAVTLAAAQMAVLLRQTRASTMDVAERDYVTFARSRSLGPRRVWQRYVLRNAALPVLTSAGLLLAYGLTGAVLVENVFALQGLGTLLVTSVSQLDLPVVQGLAMFTAFLVLTVNLLVDLLYYAADPRLRRAAVTA